VKTGCKVKTAIAEGLAQTKLLMVKYLKAEITNAVLSLDMGALNSRGQNFAGSLKKRLKSGTNEPLPKEERRVSCFLLDEFTHYGGSGQR